MPNNQINNTSLPISAEKICENTGNVTFRVLSTIAQREELRGSVLNDCTISWNNGEIAKTPLDQVSWLFSGIITNLREKVALENSQHDSNVVSEFKRVIRKIL